MSTLGCDAPPPRPLEACDCWLLVSIMLMAGRCCAIDMATWCDDNAITATDVGTSKLGCGDVVEE